MNQFKAICLLLLFLGFTKDANSMIKYPGFSHFYEIAEKDDIKFEGILPLKVLALLKVAEYSFKQSASFADKESAAYGIAAKYCGSKSNLKECMISLYHLRDLALNELRLFQMNDQIFDALPACFHYDLVKDAIEHGALEGYPKNKVLRIIAKYANNDPSLKAIVTETK